MEELFLGLFLVVSMLDMATKVGRILNMECHPGKENRIECVDKQGEKHTFEVRDDKTMVYIPEETTRGGDVGNTSPS